MWGNNELMEQDNDMDCYMEARGFRHATNFDVLSEDSYKQAAKLHGVKYEIVQEVYDVYGRKIKDQSRRAFYVNLETPTTEAFWDTLNELELEASKIS